MAFRRWRAPLLIPLICAASAACRPNTPAPAVSPPPPAVTISTPARVEAGRHLTWKHPSGAFSVTLPDWNVEALSDGLFAARAPSGDADVFLGLLAVGDDFQPDGHSPLLYGFFAVEYPGASGLLLRVERQLTAHSESSVRFDWNGATYRGMAYLYPRQNRAALIAFVGLEAAWDDHAAAFDSVLNSLADENNLNWSDAEPASTLFVAGRCASILNGLAPLAEAQTTPHSGAGWQTLAPENWKPGFTRDGAFALFEADDETQIALGWIYPEQTVRQADWAQFTRDAVKAIDESARVTVNHLAVGTPSGIVADVETDLEDNTHHLGCLRAIPIAERRIFVVAYFASAESFSAKANAWVRAVASLAVQ